MHSTKSKEIYFISNACEEGRLKTQKLKLFVKDAGFDCTQNISQADFILFNACGHLTSHEHDAKKIIKKIIKKKNLSAQIIVWGCLPIINPTYIQDVYTGPLIGPEDWAFFSKLFNQPEKQISKIFANTPHKSFTQSLSLKKK